MVRLISKNCILAFVVVVLFVTFATFFDSFPQSSYFTGTATEDVLKGAVEQVPAQADAPHTRHTVVSAAPTSSPKPDKDQGEKTDEEKVRAEEFRREEEDKKQIFDATKVSKIIALSDFSVPADIKFDPEGPRPDQIILLCAADGKGHNGGIENLFEQAQENRQAYADLHSYKYHFLNISNYDIAPAHPVWGKLPAIAETFKTFPDAQWVWWLDLDAILMSPLVDLNELLLSHKALDKQLLRDYMINKPGGGKSGVSTPKNLDVKNIDIIISQDQNGINAGSFFIRRSEWSRNFLDIWADPLLVMRSWSGREQESMMHLVLKHHTVMEHVGFVGQRVLNSYPIDTPHMGWAKGDLVVHLAGCWVDGECDVRWTRYMALREIAPEKNDKHIDS